MTAEEIATRKIFPRIFPSARLVASHAAPVEGNQLRALAKRGFRDRRKETLFIDALAKTVFADILNPFSCN